MRLKRLTAFLLSLSMLAGFVVMPESGLAYNDEGKDIFEYDSERADIVYEYLGTSASLDLSGGLSQTDSSDFTWNKGGYMWVGVSLQNLDKAADIITGLDNFQISLLYDNRYFSFDPSQKDHMFSAMLNLKDPSDTKLTTSSYQYLEASVFPFDSDEYQEWLDDYPDTGCADDIYVTNTADKRDNQLTEAMITLNRKSSTYILKSADSNKHMLIVFPLQMISEKGPVGGTGTAADQVILQNYANANNAVLNFNGDDINFERYAEDEYYMGYWFNIVDNIRTTNIGTPDGDPDPKNNASVTPKTSVYDKTDDGTNHYDSLGRETRTFTYTNNDAGNLKDVYYDGTKLTEETDYTRTVIEDDEQNEIGCEITILKDFLDAAAVGSHTLRFEVTETDYDDQTATLEIEQSINTVSVVITSNHSPLESGETLTISHEEYNDTTDSYDTIVDGTTLGTYNVKPGIDYTITATYNDAVTWSMSPAAPGGSGTGIVVSTTTDEDDTCTFMIDGTDADPNGYTITATFGLNDPKFTPAIVGSGSIVLSDGTTDTTCTSGNDYTLVRGTTYTVTITPDAQ